MKEFRHDILVKQLEREENALRRAMELNQTLSSEIAEIVKGLDLILDQVSALRSRIERLSEHSHG